MFDLNKATPSEVRAYLAGLDSQSKKRKPDDDDEYDADYTPQPKSRRARDADAEKEWKSAERKYYGKKYILLPTGTYIPATIAAGDKKEKDKPTYVEIENARRIAAHLEQTRRKVSILADAEIKKEGTTRPYLMYLIKYEVSSVSKCFMLSSFA